MSEDKTQSFEAILERLETIAEKLESGEAKLEEALSLFEEGVRLCRTGTTQLDAAEQRLEVLLSSGDTQAFEPEGADA